MQLFNQALLARQAWRLLDQPDSLCARVLRAKYFPNGLLTDAVFSANASSTWHAIEFGLQLLKQGIIWRIGDGTKVRIWRDPWIPREYSLRPITPKWCCRLRWVSELLQDSGQWDLQKLNQHFFPVDVQEIQKIKA